MNYSLIILPILKYVNIFIKTRWKIDYWSKSLNIPSSYVYTLARINAWVLVFNKRSYTIGLEFFPFIIMYPIYFFYKLSFLQRKHT